MAKTFSILMSSGKGSLSLEDYQDGLVEPDELDELYQLSQEIAREIRSVTSASQSYESPSESVDAKLQALLSTRSYDAIVQRSKDIAVERYYGSLDSELNALLANHETIESQIGTSSDQSSPWRIDSHGASHELLSEELVKLQKKMERIEAQNRSIAAGNHDKRERLAIIEAQNEKLLAIRDRH
jgi:hypothetical protein